MLRCISLLILAFPLCALEEAWERSATFSRQLEAAEVQIHCLRSAVRLIGRNLPMGKDQTLDEANAKILQAQKAYDTIAQTTKIPDMEAKLRTLQAEQNAAIDAILADTPAYQSLIERLAKASLVRKTLEAKLPGLSPADLHSLIVAQAEEEACEGQLYGLRRVLWEREGVKAIHKQVAAQYKMVSEAKSAKSIDAAAKTLKEARKNLETILEQAAKLDPEGAKIAQKLQNAEESQKILSASQAVLHQSLRGAWTTVKVTLPVPNATAGNKKARPAPSADMQIPADCKQIRGILFSFMGTVEHDPLVMQVLREENFVQIKLHEVGLFTVTGQDPATFDALLAALAQASKHPELVHVPWLTAGCSTTTITARNIAYWKPERCLGVIHFAGGNMHQSLPPAPCSLAGIPLLAVNGEWECFGPEGGIRPEYGRQTQWIMIREQFLRLRRQDPRHFLSLLVIPRANHAGWSWTASPIAALFVRKAIKARLPEVQGLPSAPITCKTIVSGWLSDADICEPKQAPAPEGTFAGKPDQAFWHLDEEMAKMIEEYHRGKFLLPDPSKKNPVPADWPPK